MLGKTHATVGVLAGLMIMQPHDPYQMAMGAAVAMTGALLPDTDSEHSLAQQGIKKILKVVVAVGALVAAYLYYKTKFKLELDLGTASINLVSPLNVIGMILLMAFGIFGETRPHREIMHSVLAMMIGTLLAWMAFPHFAIYFFVGYASHLLLDMLNYQGIQLLYPKKKKFSLGLCKSGGKVNTMLSVIGVLLLALEVYFLLNGTELLKVLINSKRLVM